MSDPIKTSVNISNGKKGDRLQVQPVTPDPVLYSLDTINKNIQSLQEQIKPFQSRLNFWQGLKDQATVLGLKTDADVIAGK